MQTSKYLCRINAKGRNHGHPHAHARTRVHTHTSTCARIHTHTPHTSTRTQPLNNLAPARTPKDAHRREEPQELLAVRADPLPPRDAVRLGRVQRHLVVGRDEVVHQARQPPATPRPGTHDADQRARDDVARAAQLHHLELEARGGGVEGEEEVGEGRDRHIGVHGVAQHKVLDLRTPAQAAPQPPPRQRLLARAVQHHVEVDPRVAREGVQHHPRVPVRRDLEGGEAEGVGHEEEARLGALLHQPHQLLLRGVDLLGDEAGGVGGAGADLGLDEQEAALAGDGGVLGSQPRHELPAQVLLGRPIRRR
mmetsp:Transcript_13590/g.37610  ORF Transcript_13590/g.37610 Transcript_13590/m.37610 type:complete len:308 (-) Transcript_13590:514-1437(-)